MRKLFLILMTLMACSWSLSAQTRTIHGTVLDAANNEPLIGATIMPIGGGQGAAADVDGKFTLTVPSSVKKATVSYVGYTSKTVDLTNGMTVYLASSDTSLDDVVVIAYGTGTKESLTGSVAVVGSKDIEDRPVTSVTSALEGNAPGVQVNNSTGQPGSSPAIRIRGFNSFTSAQAPLYVVDGVVYDGGIADLNPNDIESMSVLKDAASCALYGNRGANGVILINTKRAKGGKVDVTVQVRQGIYERGLPFYDTLDANTWMETTLDAWAKGNVTQGLFSDVPSAIQGISRNFVSTFMQNQNIYDRQADQVFDPATGKLQANVLPGYTDLDWWDIVSRTGYRQEYNLNAAGSTDKFNIFSSVAYLKEQGYMLQTDFERFSGRLTADFQPTNYLKVGANVATSYTKSEDGSADADDLGLVTNPFLTSFYAPVQPYYAHDPETGEMLYNDDGSHIWNVDGLCKGDNVAWTMRLNRADWTTLNVNASVYGTIFLPYGFEATVRGNMMRVKSNGTEYSNDKVGSQKGSGGLDLTGQSVNSHTFMQTLTWNHDFGNHNIDLLLDHENYEYGYDVQFLRKSGQLLPDNYYASNFESMDYSSQSLAKLRSESYLGRVRYNYDQKYFGEFSLRRDGTSRFAKDNRWGTFWSVGASWIITKEKFMQELEWLNYLKLRAAYGAVGNDAAASYYSSWSTYYQSSYAGTGTLIPYSLAASNLRWESTKTLDIALEGSLFNDRFTFSVGYFDKRNADLLYNVTLPASAGSVGGPSTFGSSLREMRNVGTMSNRGWELQFGVDIVRNADFKWHADLDASFVKNKIVALPDGHSIPSQSLFIGKSLYQHYTYEWAGVDTKTGNSLYYMAPDSPDLWYWDDNGDFDTARQKDEWENQVASAKASGHYFEDENGTPLTDRTTFAYRRDCGTAIPTVYGSIGTQLSWKGINLGILMTYSLGGKTYNSNYASLMSFSQNSAGALHKDILKAWNGTVETRTPDANNVIHVNSGDIDPNQIPVNNTYLSQYNSGSSSQFLISNNYLCMKNLNVSYDFPQKWVDPMKLKNLNLGFSVDNLFIITRQKGLNPQYGFGGGQGAFYVPSRVFSFQLTAKF